MSAFKLQLDRLQRDGKAEASIRRVASSRRGGAEVAKREAKADVTHTLRMGRYDGIRSGYTKLRLLYE